MQKKRNIYVELYKSDRVCTFLSFMNIQFYASGPRWVSVNTHIMLE